MFVQFFTSEECTDSELLAEPSANNRENLEENGFSVGGLRDTAAEEAVVSNLFYMSLFIGWIYIYWRSSHRWLLKKENRNFRLLYSATYIVEADTRPVLIDNLIILGFLRLHWLRALGCLVPQSSFYEIPHLQGMRNQGKANFFKKCVSFLTKHFSSKTQPHRSSRKT